ncbi:molecular chaperone HscC [Holdemanella biformis]|uniref:molecular chaperone HscC n=1 Tax=Holdemanella biformis TaxID=1735 RepID=UPI001C3887C3|nr:molecular chaperone HscC [Holdemanella biformis]MBV4131268.1 molecular chaperone HscC [Holdemanella biformis]MBV4151089.1 molecular chaperone HscC [Holdemanella biformis]
MTILGVDLGTTNSLAVVYKEGKPVRIPNAYGEYVTASAVSILDGKIVVGKLAKERLITHPECSASLFKRNMGSDVTYTLDRKEYDSATLSSFVVKQLIEDAQNYLHEEISEVVISVPAYFNARQRQDTKRIGELLGIKVERLINEPSAAAIACHMDDEYETFVVFDFGGGTLDVSVVDCFENVISINAISGNNHLGGTDFDRAMAEYFCLKNELNYNVLDSSFQQSILRTCEQAKIKLSTQNVVEVSLVHLNKNYNCIFDENVLFNITHSLLESCKNVIGKAVKDSGFSASELDSLILVGGSSKMPVLQHYLSDALNIPVLKEEHMDSLVVLGLGKYIGIKQRDENIKDVVVTDICPFSLSTSTYNEQNPDLELSTVLIPKNSVLPTSKKMTLRTVHKGQTKVNISVFQGQAMYAKENLFLGQAFIHVPRNMHDYESFDLIYSYDINSMLYVEAVVHSTKEHYIFRVSKGDVLEKVDASVRLDSIKEVSLGLYQNNEVDALLARIERIYREVDEETQDYLMKLHTEFTKDMESLINNIQKRKRLINQVSRILDQIEESQNVDQLDIFTQEEDEEGEYLA